MDRITSGVLCQFAVESIDTTALVGTVVAYEPWLDAGHVKLGFLRCSEQHSADADGTLEGLVLLLLFVFRRWPLRKVYLELPEYNDWIAGTLLSEIATLEGDLRDYLYCSNRAWNMRIYSLTRAAFALAMTGWTDEPLA